MVYVIQAGSRFKEAENMHPFADIRFKLEPWEQGNLVPVPTLNLIESVLQVWKEVLAQKVVIRNAHNFQTLLITGLGKFLCCVSLLSVFERRSAPMPHIRGCLHLQVALHPAHAFVRVRHFLRPIR